MKGLVMSTTEYLEDLLPPILVGEEIESLLRADRKLRGLRGVSANLKTVVRVDYASGFQYHVTRVSAYW